MCCFEHWGAEVTRSQTTRSAGVCPFASGTLRYLVLHLLYKPLCGSNSIVLTRRFFHQPSFLCRQWTNAHSLGWDTLQGSAQRLVKSSSAFWHFSPCAVALKKHPCMMSFPEWSFVPVPHEFLTFTRGTWIVSYYFHLEFAQSNAQKVKFFVSSQIWVHAWLEGIYLGTCCAEVNICLWLQMRHP